MSLRGYHTAILSLFLLLLFFCGIFPVMAYCFDHSLTLLFTPKSHVHVTTSHSSGVNKLLFIDHVYIKTRAYLSI
jgi:hypothetical protein